MKEFCFHDNHVALRSSDNSGLYLRSLSHTHLFNYTHTLVSCASSGPLKAQDHVGRARISWPRISWPRNSPVDNQQLNEFDKAARMWILSHTNNTQKCWVAKSNLLNVQGNLQPHWRTPSLVWRKHFECTLYSLFLTSKTQWKDNVWLKKKINLIIYETWPRGDLTGTLYN